jgi:hypothetical protein
MEGGFKPDVFLIRILIAGRYASYRAIFMIARYRMRIKCGASVVEVVCEWKMRAAHYKDEECRKGDKDIMI